MSMAASCIAAPLPLEEPAKPALEPLVPELSPPTEVVPLALDVPGKSVALVPLVPLVLLGSAALDPVSVEVPVSSEDDEELLREDPVVPELPALL